MAGSRNDILAVEPICRIEYKVTSNSPKMGFKVDFFYFPVVSDLEHSATSRHLIWVAVFAFSFPLLSSINHLSPCQAQVHRLEEATTTGLARFMPSPGL